MSHRYTQGRGGWRDTVGDLAKELGCVCVSGSGVSYSHACVLEILSWKQCGGMSGWRARMETEDTLGSQGRKAAVESLGHILCWVTE